MKINLGCGGNILDGFLNYDDDVDISKPLPWKDNSIEFILAEHVFEHISPQDGLRFLDECRRILKPGGTLRLCVPVLDALTVEHGRDIVFNHGHAAAYTVNTLDHMLRLAGFRSFGPSMFKEQLDGHHKVIGRDKDLIETSRWEASK